MRYQVPSVTLTTIRELREKQHQNVRAIGEAVIEHRLAFRKLLDAQPADVARVGALQVEYERALEIFFGAVNRTQAEQQAAGEAALATLGLGGDAQHRINEETGVVTLFEAGRWLEDF